MISVLQLDPGILGYVVNGKIEKIDIDSIVSDMDAKVPALEKVRLYIEVSKTDGITPEAFLRDMQLGLPRTPYLFKIQRLAVVTDISGVKTFANAQAKVARWFETRVFTVAEKATALAWLRA